MERFLSMFVLFKIIQAADIICDGSFQSYPLTSQNPNVELYQSFSSNYSCWYNQNGGTIKIRDQILKVPIGKCADLINDNPYVLCQDVELTENQTYEISFQVGNSRSIQSSTVIVKLNNVVIVNFTAEGIFALFSVRQKFTAISNLSTICFSSTDKRYIYNQMTRGPVISKVTVILAPNINIKKQIFISCSRNKQDLSKIAINCDTSQLINGLVELIKRQIQIYIEGESIKVKQISNNQNILQIIADYKKSTKLTNLTLAVFQPISLNSEFYKINFLYGTQSTTYIYQKQNEIEFIKQLYSVVEKMMLIANSTFAALRSTLAAYFIMNIINFWNLCLLYNLLNIPTVPLFLKLFYEQLLYRFFNMSSILNWLNTNIPGFQDKFNFVTTLDREHMIEIKHDFGWFGYFGISSQFLANNIEQFLMIGVLIIKLFALAKIRKIICKQFANSFPKGIYFASIFIKQLFVSIIFMALSSFADILQSGYLRNSEKLNGVLQYLALWICIIVYPIHFFIQMRIKRKKIWELCKKQKNKSLKKQMEKQKQKTIALIQQIQDLNKKKKVIRKKMVISCLDNVLDVSFYFIVPSLILLDCPTAFLIIMTVLIWMRCWWFFKFSGKLGYSRRKKIFSLLNLLAWFIHHHIYVFFYVAEILSVSFEMVFDDNMFDSLKVCGYVSILTIFIGGICEILNFILDFLLQVRCVVKIIWKKINEKQIMPKRQKLKSKNVEMNSKQNGTVIRMRIKTKNNLLKPQLYLKQQMKKEDQKLDKMQEKDNEITKKKRNILKQKQGRGNNNMKTIFHQ